MKSSTKARLEIWAATLIVLSACLVMKFSSPGVPRTMLFIASAFIALWLIIASVGHTKKSGG